MGFRVVCISRTTAAGGEDVGQAVAQQLGFRYVDEQIIKRAAQHAQVDPVLVAKSEHHQPLLQRLLEKIPRSAHAAGMVAAAMTRTYEPLSFIYTDGSFMKDHNDVFNSRVSAYLLTIAIEARERKMPVTERCHRRDGRPAPWRFHCSLTAGFDEGSCEGFGGCFERFQAEMPQILTQ